MNDLENIIGDQSRAMLLAGCSENCYKLFNSNLRRYFNKFTNEKVKYILNPLIENDLVKIGYPEKNKNLLLGQVIRTMDFKVAGIVINNITHDIDRDGNSLQFDKIISSIYYIFIEFAIRKLFLNEIKSDKLLLQKVERYINFILVKYLRLYELYPEKRILFDFLVKLFFYRFIADMNINLAYELSLSAGNEELIKSTIDIRKIDKFKNINDLYNALYDYNIISMTPNNMKYMLTNNIGIFSYITLHANISSIIASIIVSKYSHPNFVKLFISTDMINGIESIILDSYLTKVSYNINILNKKIESLILSNLESLNTVV